MNPLLFSADDMARYYTPRDELEARLLGFLRDALAEVEAANEDAASLAETKKALFDLESLHAEKVAELEHVSADVRARHVRPARRRLGAEQRATQSRRAC